MAHCDADTLALAALGEPVDATALAHLSSCSDCAAAVAELAEVVRAAGPEPMQWADPPDRVWSRVRESTREGSVVDLAARRRPRGLLLAAGVAAVAAALVAGFALGRYLPSQAGSQEVATAALTAPPGQPAAVTASAVLRERDGTFTVDIDTMGMPRPAGYYEVWLMTPDASGLVPIGTMAANQTHATFPVPAGLPLSQFRAVDISDEPFDGNPGHSAQSILRGAFAL